MPRKPRVHVEDGFCHVLSRGNNKQEIFSQPKDYLYYLSILDKYGPRHNITLHAYVLMPNHVHLIVQTGSSLLARFLQVVQQTYAQSFNRRYNRVGHVFQGRYKCLMIENDAYLLTLIRYIHLNPVRAGLCSKPGQYPWSSHHHYTTGQGPGTVDTTFVKSALAYFGGRTIDDYELLPDLPEAFPGNTRSLPQQPTGRPVGADFHTALPDILHAVAKIIGVSASDITGLLRTKEATVARRLFIYCATRIAGHRPVQVAEMLGRTDSYISMANNYAVNRIQQGDHSWIETVNSIRRALAGGDSGTSLEGVLKF